MNKKFTTLLLFTFCAFSQAQISVEQAFGAFPARDIGPALMSGRITDLEGHPTNPRVLFIGTAGGGVWKTENGGATTRSIFDDYNQSIGAIEVDPHDPDNTLWVGTGEIWTRNSTSYGSGLYKTTDGGKNWELKGFTGKDSRIASIIVHPDDPKTVYVAVLGALWGDSDERGVYKTTDGGETWTQLLYIDQKTGCNDLIMDPTNPNVLYAAFWEFRRQAWSFTSGGDKSALYKSIDGGKTWNKIHNGFPKGQLGRIAVAAAPSEPNRLYAVLETEKDEDKGLWRSDDAGKSWKHLNNDFGLVVRPFYFSRIVVDPNNPDVVVKGGLFGSISHDGGNTFKNLGPMHADIHDIWFDKNDSDRMFVGTDGGVYRSWDGGSTMEIIEDLPVSQFYHISVNNEKPYKIFGGLQDNGSWYGPSASPGGIEARDWEPVGGGDGFRVYNHPSRPEIIYSEIQGADYIWRTNTKNKTIKVIRPYALENMPKLRFNWNAAITTSPNNPDRLYVGSQFLHRSNDMGDSWEVISPDLTTNDPSKQKQDESGGLSTDNSGAENHCTIFTIAESPKNEKVIWVGTDDGQVQLSKNGGKSWNNLTKNIKGLPANTWCYHIEPSVFDEGTAYAVFDGHTKNDFNPYLFKTTDFGKTWQRLTQAEQVPTFARVVQEDLNSSNILYLGTELGLYISLDGGKNWERYKNEMPAAAVHAIEFQKEKNDVVVGTHGRGVYIIDDVSPIAKLSGEETAPEVQFIKTQPWVIDDVSTHGGASTETQFVGNNPSSSAQIIYNLAKRHVFGKMELKVFDQEGREVADLSPGKQKGINKVRWNFRMPMPKVAKGKTLSFGSFGSPTVPAGTYKVVLTKGKETYESEIELIYNPESTIPLDARKLQHKTALELYDMTEDLAYLVYQVDEYMAVFEGMEEAQSVANQLQALKETLVITKGDNYVNSAEPQLREKISTLYGHVLGYAGKPGRNQLERLEVLKDQLQKAQKDFMGIKEKKILPLIQKQNITVELKTKEDFLND